MAAFSIPAQPDFNVTHVEQVKESDYVINTFVNGYFQTFLQNDRYLQNQIANVGSETDKKIEDAQVNGCTSQDITNLLAKFK